MPRCLCCSDKFPNHMIVDGKKRNLQNRKYCLNCSPFGKHNTTDIVQKKINEKNPNRFCVMCKTFVPKNLFYKRRKNDSSPYCKDCSCKKSISRQQTFKEFCVNHKGGKCSICGYKKCLAALEFHHKNPIEKDFAITRMRSKSINKELIKELDKCILVCANCHRELHYAHTIKIK